MPQPTHAFFMQAALHEAEKGLGQTSPNPAVGAVLVAGGKIISRAHHRAAGAPHAEVACLAKIRSLPPLATLYVTLEPCSTVGKTGPCTDAIIRSGIRHVVIGAIDPNPKHAGRGVALLQAEGIAVKSGILEEECRALNEAFNKWITTGLPFVIAKCGMSLDGRLTRPEPNLRWITGPAARKDAHRLRAQMDAILVGAETVRSDNPRLTVRAVRKVGAKQPWRVVLTRSGQVPKKAHLLCDSHKDRTMIYRNQTLTDVLKDLGDLKCVSVLIEGGADVLGQAIDQRLIDKVQFYVGPMLTGGPVPAGGGEGAAATEGAMRLERVSYTRLGNDVRVTGYPGAGSGIVNRAW